MASLSERAAEFVGREVLGTDGYFTLIDLKSELMLNIAEAVEKLVESNHSLATKCESMQLRIEELEAQLTALAPPKVAVCVHSMYGLNSNNQYACIYCGKLATE